MKNTTINRTALALLCGAGLLTGSTAWSAPRQVTLYAKLVWINPLTGSHGNAAGSGRIPMWGFSTSEAGEALVPGPQINVSQGEFADGLEITVVNQLAVPVSLVIPGLNSMTVDGSPALGQPIRFGAGDSDYPNRVRSFVPEVGPGGTHVYRWTNLKPGTFVYHSGTHPALQVQMGLFGMVTIHSNDTEVYPGIPIGSGGEVPVIFSEIDPVLHQAVADGKYGPLPLVDADGNPTGNISSTIHSVPSLFLINGRAYDHNSLTPPEPLTSDMINGGTTTFRMINAGWNSHIPALTGPKSSNSGSANYLKVIAEDGEPYVYPKTLYAPNLAAMKTMDVQFAPPAGGAPQDYQLYDRKLGLANGGGMFRTLVAHP